MTRLVEDRAGRPNWDKQPYKGIVTDSVVVLVVRKGNPKDIHAWDDLTEQGRQVVTPNPFSSGSARWNIMAAYGSQIQQGKSAAGAGRTSRPLLEKTVAQPDSGRKALPPSPRARATCCSPTRTRRSRPAGRRGRRIRHPRRDNPDRNPDRGRPRTPRPAARSFLDFVWPDKARRLFAENGYRPVDQAARRPEAVPDPEGLFTISQVRRLGQGRREFFDQKNGSIAKIEERTGSLHQWLRPLRAAHASAAPAQAGLRPRPGSAPASAPDRRGLPERARADAARRRRRARSTAAGPLLGRRQLAPGRSPRSS